MNTKSSVKPFSKQILYPELSYRVMEAVFEVHNQLGPGFTEDIYEKALCLELKARNIPYEAQKSIEVCYKGQFLGNYRLDLVVNQQIILELKAVSEVDEVHKQQLLSYLKATGLHLGILINFGKRRVTSERILD